jgi:hypothetical protein
MNGRYIIDKMAQALKGEAGAQQILQDLDFIDRVYSEEALANVLDEISGKYPDAYVSIPDAAQFLVHVRTKPHG